MHPTTSTDSPPAGIAATLKARTWDLHQQAENGRLQKRLVKGELDRRAYAAHLGQLYLVHEALEACLDQAAQTCPHVRAVNAEPLRHVGNLRADLSHLGSDPDSVEPVPATEDMVRWIRRTAEQDPTALIGVQYVLEGSTNGNGFIARAIGPALGLKDDGLRYLVSYGPAQRQTWAGFKARLDALELSDDALERVVAAARRTFEAVRDINAQLLDRLSQEADSAPSPHA